VKVILKRDVRGLGREGELKEVKSGYARNFLIPTGAVQVADAGALKNWERHRTEREDRERALHDEAEATAEKLRAVRLEVGVKAGEKNRLFGSVTNREIAELLAREGIEVDRHQVVLKEPIKTVGEHRVTVHVFTGIDASVLINVTPLH
jgi:large subunit ribosomal protein L9